MILLTYYLLAEGDYNKLLLLLNRTRNPELYVCLVHQYVLTNSLLCYSLTVKIVAQMHINRPDLAENTLRILKSVDEDNCLTILSTTWLHVSVFTNVAILLMTCVM